MNNVKKKIKFLANVIEKLLFRSMSRTNHLSNNAKTTDI